MVLSSQQVKSELDFRVSTLPTHLGALGRTIMYHITIIKPHCLGGFDVSHLERTFFSTFRQNHDYFWWSTESKPHWSLTEACLSLSLSKENIRVMGIPANFSLISEIGYSKTPCILIMVNHHFPHDNCHNLEVNPLLSDTPTSCCWFM